MKKFSLILNLIDKPERFSILFFAVLCLSVVQTAPAQQTPRPTQTPSVIAPVTKPDTKNPPSIYSPVPRPYPTPPKEAKKIVANDSFAPAEKSIATESKVNINLCVLEGSVKINGWDRDEVRAFVQDGSQVGFKVVQKNPKSDKPVWVYVLGFDPQKNKEVKPEDCLSGREIELDVPRNATIKLKSGESDIKIESVAKVSVESLSGDVYLNDIANGIDATTYQGDLMVEKSAGQMTLVNTAGNIIALDVAPSEIGDFFKAKTNSGRITLKSIEHRLVETGTLSGSTSFDGELLSGGQYNFTTQNGSIGLAVAPSSVCRISAWFGFGAFVSEMPLENILKKEQSLSAQIGAGDASCSLNLKTGSGVIRMKSSTVAGKTSEKTKTPEKTKTTQTTNTVSFVQNKTVKLNQCALKNPTPRVKINGQ